MMKFKTVINLLFLTAVMSSSVFSQVNSVMNLPQIETVIICRFFKPEPPVQGDGGSRFAEPSHHQNQDNFPDVQA
ncbi:hypothetical protein VB834_06605 [Limnoraphis robusta Tam1]|uniref:Secreted protein n=1 Tax=Limnoraphis robusta CCNP1315 TaxID=3110306 RepID=A0ABU5TUJ9_9CYAN|nr:hypothetical protein [Limnoraphis robusta]MEA5499852.1 hypothetical protein [Limnoraphis robusta BA-68 BA1]MEA5518570.1 hypothetical protein [Limnoraphis robusta CCNP1315]MEA5538700.1 hypothetical protein [Limnoraphis robusta Tam1]MEA5548035.1 hypothetical protein [Limnoraphis robusta CCNP1324]